jgi:hypothetical protein
MKLLEKQILRYYFSRKSPRSYSGTGGGPICSGVSLPDLTNNGF